jgi:RNA polymerase sigma-70 factor (ECF subfamily)
MEQFETYRPLMFAIAYRMVGSATDAEDIVQDTYLRYCRTPAESIGSHKAFLSTIVTRLCLNYLESAHAQREVYVGPWLPEPLITDEKSIISPTERAEVHESISLAFLILLERLTPVERAVFLLREVFDYSYTEIAGIVDKEEVTCRQILRRAKKFLADNRPRFRPSPEQHRKILQRFMQAVEAGNLADLMQMLSTDVTMWADGGGRIRGAATRPLHGPVAVGRFTIGSLRYIEGTPAPEILEVNGDPAILLRADGHPLVIVDITVERGLIREIRVIGNPDKLRRIH